MDKVLENPIAIALATAVVMWIAGWVRTFLARRVRVSSPEAIVLEQIVPAVNVLLELQGPQMVALTAILEAQKGICNGNVDAALEITRKAKAKFDTFLVGTAKIERPS